LFGGGLFGGVAAGFLGAGLFGLLFGHGLFGGMAGFASMIGLLLQVVLVVIVARLIFAWWQRRNMQPAYAAAHPVTGRNFGGVGEMLGGANLSPAGEQLAIAKSDYDAFAPILVDTDITARQLLTNLLYTNGIGTLLALAFLARPIRAVGPLVLVFMIATVGGAMAPVFSRFIDS
jgi:hypothetical protein